MGRLGGKRLEVVAANQPWLSLTRGIYLVWRRNLDTAGFSPAIRLGKIARPAGSAAPVRTNHHGLCVTSGECLPTERSAAAIHRVCTLARKADWRGKTKPSPNCTVWRRIMLLEIGRAHV